ncbi:MAG: Swt1 family HEPN domain-containing protein, partial [Planctomycetia bacterium]
MAISNQDRMSKAMELLRSGLSPFVLREFTAVHKQQSLEAARRYLDERVTRFKALPDLDVAGLLKLMWTTWHDVFRNTLGPAERSLVHELIEWRNKWAHQQAMTSDDTDRALDSMVRLLSAVSALEADEVNKSKQELRRQIYEEQVRHEKRKNGGTLIETAAASSLRSWRDLITPHADVASGRYQQAEFAADLWQVYKGEGSDEYRNPREFFRRTFLTESLKALLVAGVQRLSGAGGDPVVQLQTNFGGGKTHSMLALYHLFSGANPAELVGVDAVMAEAGVKTLPRARCVVLVGNKISPGNPSTKPDGTVVRTLWGELAWQLGGQQAFARVQADDEKATNPGDVLRELFRDYGPCLVLIDEWVAYA